MPAVLRHRRPATVAAAVMALYGAWIGAYLIKGGDVRDFIHIGTHFIAQGHGRSREIRLDPGYHPPRNQNPTKQGMGYDGQFTYYIALDPAKARYYIDLPSYRYTHVLQPMLVRVLAMDDRDAIPWLLVVVNWLAVGGGTWALAVWLRRRGVAPAWAGLYALWSGMFIALQRDLTEPLAYGLVPAAALLLDTGRRWRVPAAGIVFGLAGLARQTTLVFPLVYALWLAFRGEVPGSSAGQGTASWRRGALLLGISVAPYVAYSLFLLDWLGSLGTGASTAVPFGSLIQPPFDLTRQGLELVVVIAPAVVVLVAMFPRRPFGDPLWLPWLFVLANFLVNVVFYGDYQHTTYTSVSRYGIGIVLSALMCLPYAGRIGERRRAWLAGATAVAMILLPVVAVYGFTNATAPT